jgi:hypothetical protein
MSATMLRLKPSQAEGVPLQREASVLHLKVQ